MIARKPAAVLFTALMMSCTGCACVNLDVDGDGAVTADDLAALFSYGTDDGGNDNGGTDDGGTDNGGTDSGGTDDGGTETPTLPN